MISRLLPESKIVLAIIVLASVSTGQCITLGAKICNGFEIFNATSSRNLHCSLLAINNLKKTFF